MGLLTRVLPADVDAASGHTQYRHRALPARVAAYLSISMVLYADGANEDVFAELSDGHSWASRRRESYPTPSKSAIFQARARLGHEPMRDLFARVATPLATPEMPGGLLAGRLLVAIDGTCLHVADTAANTEFFGRPASSRGEQAAFSQVRSVALA